MQQCEISVNIAVSNEAHKVLEQIAIQNQAVFLEINPDSTITLVARMFDFTEPSDDDWENFKWDTLD